MSEPWPILDKHDIRASGKQAVCFRFSGLHYEPASGEAVLSYDIDGRTFSEKITFPWAPWPVDSSRQAAFLRALELLHLIAGVSYSQVCLASRVNTGESKIGALMGGFLNELYLKGLGEFAYVNRLDLSGLINFECTADESPMIETLTREASAEQLTCAYPVDLPDRALVAMGGGKDSLVCLHMLEAAGVEVQPACVGGSVLIGETVKAAGLPLIRIQRELSPGLAKMNSAGAWNGHVPVTAINSAILLCAGFLYGYRYIVFANESSANEATLKDGQGREVNHQFSKSFAFEQHFDSVVRQYVSPDIRYFSLLRPFGEIAISRRFSKMTRFHEVFSSCNRNFHQDGSHITGRWCLDCPKCRFTALALAPFLDPSRLLAIQGADLLNQENQLDGFKALCGLAEHKPFECVGSIAECRAAMKFLAGDPRWRDKYVVGVLAGFDDIQQAGELDLNPDFKTQHCIPSEILARLNAF